MHLFPHRVFLLLLHLRLLLCYLPCLRYLCFALLGTNLMSSTCGLPVHLLYHHVLRLATLLLQFLQFLVTCPAQLPLRICIYIFFLRCSLCFLSGPYFCHPLPSYSSNIFYILLPPYPNDAFVKITYLLPFSSNPVFNNVPIDIDDFSPLFCICWKFCNMS